MNKYFAIGEILVAAFLVWFVFIRPASADKHIAEIQQLRDRIAADSLKNIGSDQYIDSLLQLNMAEAAKNAMMEQEIEQIKISNAKNNNAHRYLDANASIRYSSDWLSKMRSTK